MKIFSDHFVRLAALAFLLPTMGVCAAVQVNGVCQLGGCSAPDSIGTGQASTGSFNFNYTLADGDQYSIVGSYSNSYAPQELGFFPVVTYIGNNGNSLTPAVQNDVISLVMYQNFYDPTGSSWDGQYCEDLPFNVGTGGSANGNVYFDGNGVGFLGSGPGISNQSACANLTFTAAQNASDYIDTQVLLDFSFVGGVTAGTSISSTLGSAVPEPVETIPAALSVVALICFAGRRKSGKS